MDKGFDYGITPLFPVSGIQCTNYSPVKCTSPRRSDCGYLSVCGGSLLYSVQCKDYSVQCTVYSVQCTVYSVQCTV